MVEGLLVGGCLHVLLVLQQLLLVLELDHLSHLRIFGEDALGKWECMKIMRTTGNIFTNEKLPWKMRHKLGGHDKCQRSLKPKNTNFFYSKIWKKILKCNSLTELLNQATLSRPCLPVCLVPCLVPAQLVAREDQGMPCGTPIPQHTFQEQKENYHKSWYQISYYKLLCLIYQSGFRWEAKTY